MNKLYLQYFFLMILSCAIPLYPSIEILVPSVVEDYLTRSFVLSSYAHLGAGFFCEVQKVVDSIFIYEHRGIAIISPQWTHEFFPYKDKPHENGWDLYFESIQQAITDEITGTITYGKGMITRKPPHNIHAQKCTVQWVLYDQYLPYRTHVQEKMNKYFKIKDHIVEKVESYYNTNMRDFFCIGVHVRYAAAHAPEIIGGRHPGLGEYFAEVDNLMKARKNKKIKVFIATDSHYVVNQFRQRYGSNLLYIDAYRANNNEDPHLIYDKADYFLAHPDEWHRRKPGYQGGLTTLLDCLILSKCDYFVHTQSNFSTFVSFFNPYIKSIFLPKGFAPICEAKGNDNYAVHPFINPV